MDPRDGYGEVGGGAAACRAPFAGSGTTLIAPEQLGRRYFAIGIEPRCVQVILDRWEAFTGEPPVKL